MFRTISYSTNDYYCRFLGIGFNYKQSMKPCGGAFGSFIEKSLGINKLPYGISLIDLVLNGSFSPDLFVTLPKEYFLKWENYPFKQAKFAGKLNAGLKDVGWYDIHILPISEGTLDDYHHPYDKSLKETFTDRFSSTIPHKLELVQHPNGRTFYPYEAYFSYWRGFMLLESLDECCNIDKFLSTQSGLEIFRNTVSRINKKWNEIYKPTFNRLSHYKTFISQYKLSESEIESTYEDISRHILERTNSLPSDLESDMEILLGLHKSWMKKINNDGKGTFRRAVDILKRDIYFLFELLCGTGRDEEYFFDKWTYHNRQASPWSQLKDVLDFEELHFADTFEQYVPFYLDEIHNWTQKIDIAQTYRRLVNNDSFFTWIRSFSDMHREINSHEIIKLIQPRILDSLLVLTIRTEILIRSLYSNKVNKHDPDDLKTLLRDISCLNANDPKAATVFKAATDRAAWDLTTLRDRPENIFHKIEGHRIGKKWSNEQKFLYQSILKFVTARNYFAHHSYKDEELNSSVSKLSRSVLTACIYTVLCFEKFLDEAVVG